MSTAIPAVSLVAVNVTTMFGPAVQLASVLAVFAFFLPKLQFDLRTSWILLTYIGACLFLAVLAYGPHQAVIKAGKLALFCLASVIAVKGAYRDNRFPAFVALRAFLGLCAVNFLYAITFGDKIFRADYFIEFSIYSSYTIAILVYLARPHLTVFDRIAALGFSVMCGSTMGLMLLILAELIGRRFKLRTIIGFAALAPVGFVILNFLMLARGKEFTWAYFATSDRAKLLTTFFETTLPHFSFSNWLFGLGPGTQLHRFITPDSGFNGYLYRLGEGEIYSFCLHNEVLRVLTDFGLVGVLLIAMRLGANCSKPVLILLESACSRIPTSIHFREHSLLPASSTPDPSLNRPKNRHPPSNPPYNMHDVYQPTIAVVIAARDAAPYVAAMLESLVVQSRRPDQIVFYDDGSSDDTAAITRGFSERLPMLTVIEGDKSVGISTARNRANAEVTSDYIAVLDADDLFRPETIARYTDYIKTHRDTDLLYADTRVFQNDIVEGKQRNYPTFRTAQSAIRRALGSPLIPFKHSSMIYRREAIEKIGGYDETLPIKVDVDLFIRFHKNQMHVAKLDQTTSCHRKHARQISTNRIRGIKAYARLLKTYEPDPWVRGFLLSIRVPSELLKLLIRG